MNKKIIKNASWIIVCRIAESMINLVVSMITARYLGPSNYGVITYASSLVAFILPVVRLGINGILVQEFIEHPKKDGCIIGTATLLTTLSSLLGILGIWAFTSVVNHNEIDTIIVSVLYSISLFFQMTEMIQYWYQARLLSKYVAIISLIARIFVSVYKIYIVVEGKTIFWFAVVNSLDYLLISVGLFVIYFKLGGRRISFSTEVASNMFSRSKHFIISGLMVSVFGQTDKIMLKLLCGDAQSGYYSAAITCAGMSAFLFSAIIDSFRPIIFEYKKKNQSAYKESVVLLYSVNIYIALIQSVVLSLFADFVINLLYGKEFLIAADILKIVTWYSAFSYLGSARSIWFLAEGKEKYIWITNLIGAVINLLGNFILIPIWGACGAALSSVATQLLTNFALNFIIKPIQENGMLMIYALNPKQIYKMIVNSKS